MPGTRARTVTLRPATEQDAPLLLRVYASTREDELAPVPWTSEEKEAFVAQQFAAQTHAYTQAYPDASFDVVLADGEPAGRLTVARLQDEIRIVDIAILPEHRGAGIATQLVRDVLDEARHAGTRVTLHVERMSPAMNLYRRLGFEPVETVGIHVRMEWRPQP